MQGQHNEVVASVGTPPLLRAPHCTNDQMGKSKNLQIQTICMHPLIPLTA